MNKYQSVNKNNINYKSTFSPIRQLISFNNEKWKEFIKDKSLQNLSTIEGLFALNEIYPYGMKIWKYELGKFMGEIDTLQVTFSFLVELCKNDVNINIIEDYRMSIQNFMVYMSIKSYYSAFQEFRRMLEGLLWIESISNNFRETPFQITKKEYSSLLSDINIKYGELYSKLNNLFHYNKNKTPYFNINRIYMPKDWLYEILNDISNIADIYVEHINEKIKKINLKTINRYMILVDVLNNARKSYQLSNFKIEKTGEHYLPGKWQTEYADLILSKSKEFLKINNLVNSYVIGLKELVYDKRDVQIYNQEINIIFIYLSKFDRDFLKYMKYLNTDLINFNNTINKYLGEERNKRKMLIYKENIKKGFLVIKKILFKEILDGGNIELQILKTILEDLLINESQNKSINFSLIFMIHDMLKKSFKIDLKWKTEYNKYRHLITKERIKYFSPIKGETGQANMAHEYYKLTNEIFDVILNKF